MFSFLIPMEVQFCCIAVQMLLLGYTLSTACKVKYVSQIFQFNFYVN